MNSFFAFVDETEGDLLVQKSPPMLVCVGGCKSVTMLLLR